MAVFLTLVARPIAVLIGLWPFHYKRNELAYVSWVGLRGAVPIVLAVFPVMAGVPGAQIFFNVAFVVVLTSLLLQGSTIAWSARRLGVALPDPDDEAQTRRVFGDFVIDARTPLSQLCDFYALPLPPDGDPTLGEWLMLALNRPPVVGDSAQLGPAELSVRRMDGQHIQQIGIRL